MDRTEWSLVLIALAVTAALLWGAAMLYRAECTQKFASSGMATQYDVIAGCRVEVEDGVWIPSEAYYFRED